MIDFEPFLSRAGQVMQESAIRKMGTLAIGIPNIISFAAGYPDPDTWAWDDFREITTSLLSGADGDVLQYGPTRGFRPLLDALPEILSARGIVAEPLDSVITTGSQQGLDLAARVLIDPGDVVLVELPTYVGAITAFRNALARLVGVRQEADGVDLDALDRTLLEERAAGRRVRVFYAVANFQNPTGLLISREKRLRLLDWAEKRDVLIVEDDPYNDLYFDDVASAADTRPIKADDRSDRVVYLSSFSKTLAPGFRVAWITAAPQLVARFEIAKQAADLCSGGLDQRVIFEAWRRGLLTRAVPALRSHYRHKRDVMEQTLRATMPSDVAWPVPKGGFFLWLTLPASVSADALLTRALERQVIYVAGTAFFVDGSGSNTLRLSFSLPPPEAIEEGVRRLASVVKEALVATR